MIDKKESIEEANLDFFAELNKDDNKSVSNDRIRKRQPKRLEVNENADTMIEKIKKGFRNNTRNFAVGTAIAFLFLTLIILLIIDSSNKEKEDNVASSGQFIEIDSTPMVDAMNKYYDAMLNGEIDIVRSVLANDQEITDEEITEKCDEAKAYADLVGTSFEITNCYVQKGIKENEYVAYMKFRIQIKSIDTPTTGIFASYLIDESKEGEPDYRVSIKVNDKTTDIYKYVLKMSSCKNVADLFETVDKELESACAEDEKLKEIVDALENNSETETVNEETTAIDETTTEAAK